MDNVRKWMVVIVAGVVVLVVALVALEVFYFPWGRTISADNTKKTQLQLQVSQLEIYIGVLKKNQRNFHANCKALDLQQNAIPSEPDVDVFFRQVSALAQNNGLETPDFSVVATPTVGGGPAGTSSIQLTMTLTAPPGPSGPGTGPYRDLVDFLLGLADPGQMPRLYAVSSATVGGLTTATGQVTSQGAFTLTLTGDIYYTQGQNTKPVCPNRNVQPGNGTT